MSRLIRSIRRFASAERASMAVEGVIVLPLLLFAYGGMFVFWDAFKTQNIAQKAAYTVSDMISREITSIDQNYFDGLHSMLDYLTYRKHDSKLRVTVVRNVLPEGADEPELILSWSQASPGWMPIDDIATIENSVPPIAIGDELIIVETSMDYKPLLTLGEGLGIGDQELYHFIGTRPRFAPQIKWDDGLGDGGDVSG